MNLLPKTTLFDVLRIKCKTRNEYREAVLTFYELNSLIPFKKIFIEQYEFAAQNYAV